MDFYIAGFWLILMTLTALAWTWRDVDERGRTRPAQPELSVVTLLWAAAVLTVVLRPSLATRFHDVERAMLIIDFGLFAGLAWIGARQGKGWILCAAALQLISASAHVARLVTPGMWRLGYQVMEEASSYPLLMALAWGIIGRRSAGRRDRSSRA
jgi:hypothetical protein